MLNIKSLDTKGLTKNDTKIIEELTKVLNDNETLKEQFETYVNVMLERKELARAYEDDCVNGTLLAIFYHKDYLDDFKESNKDNIESKYIYIIYG